MPRNAEVVRQWKMLRTIEASRLGVTVQDLVTLGAVTRRTVYRDLDAMQEAGFPLLNETRDGRVRWKLGQAPFSRLTQVGFSVSELCALYLSRRMVEVLTGVPFQAPLQALFGRFEHDLPPKMRQYLDQLPSALAAVPPEGKVKRPADYESHVGALLNATLERREVQMTYYSHMHQRQKNYTVHPYRIVYAHGAMYLFAYVPEYGQIRTFALQRVKKVKELEARFTPSVALPDDPFAGSMGPNLGQPTVHVALRFSPRLAGAIRERQHHQSQALTDLPDGSLRMELDVCNDWWLHNWILGYGHLVTVESPAELVQHVVEELEQARNRYESTVIDEGPVSPAMLDWGLQGRLPFGG